MAAVPLRREKRNGENDRRDEPELDPKHSIRGVQNAKKTQTKKGPGQPANDNDPRNAQSNGNRGIENARLDTKGAANDNALHGNFPRPADVGATFGEEKSLPARTYNAQEEKRSGKRKNIEGESRKQKIAFEEQALGERRQRKIKTRKTRREKKLEKQGFTKVATTKVRKKGAINIIRASIPILLYVYIIRLAFALISVVFWGAFGNI